MSTPAEILTALRMRMENLFLQYAYFDKGIKQIVVNFNDDGMLIECRNKFDPTLPATPKAKSRRRLGKSVDEIKTPSPPAGIFSSETFPPTDMGETPQGGKPTPPPQEEIDAAFANPSFPQAPEGTGGKP